MVTSLKLLHGEVPLPAFFPDGTYGVVRGVDADDLVGVQVPGLVMNSYHLLTRPGVAAIRALGGLHAFAGWKRPILTDSGGFQVFSLIRENPKYGEVRTNEVIFRPDMGRGKLVLTPEKSIQSQFAYGSDIMMCLDYCTHPDDDYDTNARAVDITVAWAARCKREYETQLAQRRLPAEKRPLLFGIIQGGSYPELRKRCAAALIDIGFDGFGFGGFPADGAGNLVTDILALTGELMPDHLPKYAMGLGKPDGIAACHGMGYRLFDCVIPTREGRRGRLYVFDGEGTDYSLYYVLDEKHRKAAGSIDDSCDCPCCRTYSRAYLFHLFKTGDTLGARLGTLHNLRFYMRFMERLRVG